MIAKDVPRPEGGGNFARLVRYLTDPQGNPERVVHVQATNLHNTDMDDDLSLTGALAEVRALQARNTRAYQHTMHLMLSFHEDLAPVELHAIEQRLVEALGYGTHQRISVVHGDTAHCHLHIAINKVYVERTAAGKERGLCKHLEFGKRKLGALAGAIELDYGLVPDEHGPTGYGAETQEAFKERLLQGYAQAVQKATRLQELQAAGQAHDITLRMTGKTGLRLVSAEGTTLAASKLGKAFTRTALEKRFGPLQSLSLSASKAQAQSTESLLVRIKRDAARELCAAGSWAKRHQVAAAHGLRFLQRGGGLALEDLATGELVTASAVNNQLSLGRATKLLGPYEPANELPAHIALRETLVDAVQSQALVDHQRRRAAITRVVPAGPKRKRWLRRSQQAYHADRARLSRLHSSAVGVSEQGLSDASHKVQLRKLARLRQLALQIRAALPLPVLGLRDLMTTQMTLEGSHGRIRRTRRAQPHTHHVTAATPPRADSLRQLPGRSVVRAAAESAVLLPGDAHGSLFKRESGGAGRGL